MKLDVLTTFLCTSVLAAYALPPYENTIQARAAAVDNIVYVTDANKFWYVLNSSQPRSQMLTSNPALPV